MERLQNTDCTDFDAIRAEHYTQTATRSLYVMRLAHVK